MLPKCCQAIDACTPHLPAISAERMAKAKKRFTQKAVDAIRRKLNPPADYDLEAALWCAVHMYHYESDPDYLDGMSPKRRRDTLDGVQAAAGAVLSLLNDRVAAGVMRTLCVDAAGVRRPLQGLQHDLECILKRCEEEKPRLPAPRPGPHLESGRWVFFTIIDKIHRQATGRPASGPFCKLCHELLIGTIDARNTGRYVTTIGRAYLKRGARPA